MKRHIENLKDVIRHKWFVFFACLRFGVPIWSAILHDWDKFLPSEWCAYADYFYGEKVVVPNTFVMNEAGESVPKMTQPEPVKLAFDFAWNQHQKRNKHHWQYWLLAPMQPRPNFSIMSMDDGMTHATVTTTGKPTQDVALIWEASIAWWKQPPYELQQRLQRDLWSVPIPLPMPDKARREMLADWFGAGRARNKDWTPLEPRKWYEANKKNIDLHPDTRAWVEFQLMHHENLMKHGQRFALGF